MKSRSAGREWIRRYLAGVIVIIVVVLCAAAYTPGLGGGFLFDDYPNIVENKLVQPSSASLGELTAAAMSSPSSELKRPLASLSFAADFLANGLDPAAMKITNIALHGINGVLVFFLVRLLMQATQQRDIKERYALGAAVAVTAWWMLAPINLTAVLYIVQRMESMANLFVLAGLIGYTRERIAMRSWRSSALPAIAWMTIPAIIGALAKETAVLLPLYALCVEACVFRLQSAACKKKDRRIVWAFIIVVCIPFITGSAWVIPGILDPQTWATRDFTLETRLLSEPRIILSYAWWTLVPGAHQLSFYHDNFVASTGVLTPWTTAASMFVLAAAVLVATRIRRRLPLAALGIALFFACHTLTGTILPLELIYEHRNYFASLGIILTVIDLGLAATVAMRRAAALPPVVAALPALAIVALIVYSGALTIDTARAWGSPLRLAKEFAKRAPDSPRAMYELGCAYIIASHYDPASPYLQDARSALEQAALLPASSILPEQALVFLNSRMGTPIPARWWMAMQAKLAARPATIQDESSLITLANCRADGLCIFPSEPLNQLFRTALSHPAPTGRLYFGYGQFASSALHDAKITLKMTQLAVDRVPNEPVYRATLVRLLAQSGRVADASSQLDVLRQQNLQGRLDHDIESLTSAIALARKDTGTNQR